MTVMGGGVGGTGERAGVALGSGPIRKAPALPMDEASRLARAAEQGYTIDAYKGGQVHDWNTMPEYYGSGKVVPGTENRIPKELTSINSPNADYAGFFSNSPDVANRFAAPFEGGGVWPTKLKFDNPVIIDAGGRHAADFQFPSLARERGTTAEMDKFRGAFKEGSPHDGVILKNTKDEGDVYVPRNSNQVRSKFAAFDPANKDSGFLLGSGATDKKGAAAIQGIRAYHSSPHDFDRFDLSKIGTGEGAQSYGHGLYFAENPAVSGQGGQYWQQFKQHQAFSPAEAQAAIELHNAGFDRELAKKSLSQRMKEEFAPYGQRGREEAQLYKEHLDALDLLHSGKPVGPRTYEVNINADPAHMLDWDKPLTSATPKAAQDAFNSIANSDPWLKDAYHGGMRNNEPGWYYYTKLMDKAKTGDLARNQAYATDVMREAGIPGIKYLDGGSRTLFARANNPRNANWMADDAAWRKHTPTSNYVVFDPSIVNIMKKYGIAGAAPAGMGALAATGNYQPEERY